MDSDRPSSDPRPPAREQRRSGRISVLVPVTVKWQAPGEEAHQEDAEALEVNLYGAVLRDEGTPARRRNS